MVDAVAVQRWRGYAVFGAVALACVAITLLPLGHRGGGLPGPDLLTAIALVWVIRRPDCVPVGLVAAVMLLADLVQMRPPGLWAGLVVLGVEFLRARQASLRNMPFLAEWALAAAVLLAMTLARWLLLTLFFVPYPGIGLLLLQSVMTLAAYPLVVAVARHVFGLRKAAPGEVDALGHKL